MHCTRGLAGATILVTALGTAGAQRIPVTLTEGTNMAAALSPNGREIAFDLQGTLWIQEIGADEATALTDGLGDDRQPSFSPDGRRLAFQSYRDGNWHIWVVDRDGEGLRQLTIGPSDNREPHFSPDGTSVVFSSDREGTYDLWRLDLETLASRRLTDGAGNESGPSWSPDGTRVAFVADGEPAGIFTVSTTTENAVPELVARTRGEAAATAWNTSGDTLSYQELRPSDGVTELRAVSADGSRASVLSASGEDVFPLRATWSSPRDFIYTADGRIRRGSIDGEERGEIAFRASVVLDRGFYPQRRRDLDSTASRRVLGIRGPAVSPSGERVVFTAIGDLWIREGDGALTRLTDDAFVEAHPRWSPDGRRVVYVSDRAGPMNLWIRDLATGEERQVPGVSDASYPVFSPDGRRVAFFGANGASLLAARLRSVELETGKVSTLLDRQVPATEISWAAGGAAVAITVLGPDSTRFREGAYEMVTVPLDGGGPTRLSLARPDSLSHASYSPDGRRLAFVADGVLSVAEVGPEGSVAADPEAAVDVLADWPTWAGDSRRLVYLHNGVLERLDTATGEAATLPIDLSWVAQREPGRVVVHAGRLFNGRNPGYQQDVDIVVADGRIEAIAPHAAATHGDNWIDAGDRTVIPGLIEMHAHQGRAPESQGRAWLSFGVTSVRGPGEDAYDALERREAWGSGRRIGPRQFFAGRLFDGRRVYYSIAEGTYSRGHMAAALERAQRLEYDLIKTYVRLPDEAQKQVTAVAHGLGIPVSSHEIFPAAANGVDAVEHLGGTSRRGYSPKVTALGRSYGDVVTLLTASGMNLTATAVLPCYFLHTSRHPELFDNAQYRAFYAAEGGDARLPSRLAGGALAERCAAMGRTILRVIDGGGRVTVGTDSPFVPFGFGLHVELQLFAAAGLEPWQVLRSATAWSAEAIGVGDQLGTLEPGKIADLVLIDGDPLARIQDALEVRATMKGGRLYTLEELLEP